MSALPRETAAQPWLIERLPRSCLLALLLVTLTAYRLAALHAADLQLYFEEAYYWTWSTEPALGYYSKPPMIAWLMAASSSVCGESEACLRAAPMLLFLATAALVFATARRSFGPEVGFFAGLTYATLPVVAFYSWFVTTDALLSFFWALALFALARATERGLWRDWLLFGAAVGLGLLSKYTMSVFLVSLAVYLLLVPERRARFWSRKTLAAAGLALLLFLPNLAWNLAHGFASFRHTAESAHWGGSLFHVDHLVLFLAGQMVLFGPLLALASVASGWQKARAALRDERLRFAASFTVPLIALYAVQALIAKANLNWTMAAFVPGSILVAAYLIQAGQRRALIVGICLNVFLGSVVYHYGAVAERLGIAVKPEADAYGWMKGWRELAAKVQAVRDRHPDAGLIADHRRLLGELMFYLQPHPMDGVIWNPSGAISDHFRLKTDLGRSPYQSFVFVSSLTSAEELRRAFREVVDLGPVDLPRHPEQRADYRIFLVKQFLGYPS
jgi:4-amino-4-deoxy-L-arabinose transferase-like glycosyltransferase